MGILFHPYAAQPQKKKPCQQDETQIDPEGSTGKKVPQSFHMTIPIVLIIVDSCRYLDVIHGTWLKVRILYHLYKLISIEYICSCPSQLLYNRMKIADRDHQTNREIFRLAVPNILSNVSVPLLSSVDTILMGQLSSYAVAAVGVGSMVFNFLYWNMGFLRMSTTGLTAQAYGGADSQSVTATLYRSLMMAAIIACAFLICQRVLFDLGVWFMDVEPDMIEGVSQYYYSRIWGAPAALMLMVFFGWFFGLQNAKYPLYITLLINVMNIVLSFYFVKTLGLGIQGVAWGTVAAQYMGLLMAIVMSMLRYGKYVKHQLGELKKYLHGIKEVVSINQNIFFRTIFLSLTFVLIIRFSQPLGNDILAINVVFLQFLNWMSYGIDGMAYAAESLVGKFKGAADDLGIRLTILWTIVWGFIGAVLFSLLYWMAADSIFHLFMAEDYDALQVTASSFYLWLAILPLAGFSSYIWDGIYVGLTAARAMRNTMLIAFVLFLFIYCLTPGYWGNHRIWFSFIVFLSARGLLQWWLYRQYSWRGLT